MRNPFFHVEKKTVFFFRENVQARIRLFLSLPTAVAFHSRWPREPQPNALYKLLSLRLRFKKTVFLKGNSGPALP